LRSRTLPALENLRAAMKVENEQDFYSVNSLYGNTIYLVASPVLETQEIIAALRQDPNVLYVEPDQIILLPPNEEVQATGAIKAQDSSSVWYVDSPEFQQIGGPAAAEFIANHPPVTDDVEIVNIDSGIDVNNPILQTHKPKEGWGVN